MALLDGTDQRSRTGFPLSDEELFKVDSLDLLLLQGKAPEEEGEVSTLDDINRERYKFLDTHFGDFYEVEQKSENITPERTWNYFYLAAKGRGQEGRDFAIKFFQDGVNIGFPRTENYGRIDDRFNLKNEKLQPGMRTLPGISIPWKSISSSQELLVKMRNAIVELRGIYSIIDLTREMYSEKEILHRTGYVIHGHGV